MLHLKYTATKRNIGKVVNSSNIFFQVFWEVHHLTLPFQAITVLIMCVSLCRGIYKEMRYFGYFSEIDSAWQQLVQTAFSGDISSDENIGGRAQAQS